MMEKPYSELPLPEVPTGEQTKISPEIVTVSEELNGEGREYIKSVVGYLRSFDTKDTTEFTAERTASDIIGSGYWSGCHEAGLIFVSLLRAKGMKADYIQALNKEGVESYKEGKSTLNGHVYLETEVSGKKVIINSTNGNISSNIPEDMVIGGKGLDSWDIGLRKHEDMRDMFRNRHTDFLT